MKLTALAAGAFVACIVAANYLTTTYGLVGVGFGLTATAGTYLAGATFVLRDTLHDRAGAYATVALVVLGAALSYVLSAPTIAVASGAAFLVSELADLLVYAPLRHRYGYALAALASNTVGAAVDTWLFLTLAGFPITDRVFAGQMIGKLWITLAVLLMIGAGRAVLRQPFNRAGA